MPRPGVEKLSPEDYQKRMAEAILAAILLMREGKAWTTVRKPLDAAGMRYWVTKMRAKMSRIMVEHLVPRENWPRMIDAALWAVVDDNLQHKRFPTRQRMALRALEILNKRKGELDNRKTPYTPEELLKTLEGISSPGNGVGVMNLELAVHSMVETAAEILGPIEKKKKEKA